jgi:hypothetical protein
MLVVGNLLLVVGLAAAPDSDPMSGWGGYVGATLGVAIGTGARHRAAGSATAFAWALAAAASMASYFIALRIVAAFLAPSASQSELLRSNWVALTLTGLILFALSAVLWERDAKARRRAALVCLATGLLFGGLVVAIVSEWPWLGLIALGSGAVILYRQIVVATREAPAAPAETASTSP